MDIVSIQTMRNLFFLYIQNSNMKNAVNTRKSELGNLKETNTNEFGLWRQKKVLASPSKR